MKEWRFTTKVRYSTGEGEGRFAVPSSPLFQEALERYLKEKGERSNGYFEVIIVPPRRPISTGERSVMNRIHGHASWIMITMYNEEGFDWDLDTWKYFFKHRAMKAGYPADRIPTSGGGEILVPKSLGHEAVTLEHGLAVCREIEQFAAQQGISLPEYDEDGRIVFV